MYSIYTVYEQNNSQRVITYLSIDKTPLLQTDTNTHEFTQYDMPI